MVMLQGKAGDQKR